MAKGGKKCPKCGGGMLPSGKCSKCGYKMGGK